MNQELPELIKAFADIQDQPHQTIEYRLYYDENGVPTMMSSHDHPDGNYVVITKEQYDKPNYTSLRVINKELKVVDPALTGVLGVVRSTKGFKTAKNHASVLVTDTYNDIEYYDYKNN
jgi:hypothetical protein